MIASRGRPTIARVTRWRRPEQPGPRHSAEWYDQSIEPYPLSRGDRIGIVCRGGPCGSRLETFPPRLEIPDRGGTYVLVDIGPQRDWYYEFVPDG